MLKDEVSLMKTKRFKIPKDNPLRSRLDTVHTKLRWLKTQCHKVGTGPEFKHVIEIQKGDTKMNIAAIMGAMLFVERLEDKVDNATLPTREELHKCNDLLAILKKHCYFEVDWRTDIVF